MFIALLFSDNDQCVEPYIVERNNYTIDYDVPADKIRDCFNKDWKKSLTKARRQNKTVLYSDVIEIMNTKGWQMLQVSHKNVTRVSC